MISTLLVSAVACSLATQEILAGVELEVNMPSTMESALAKPHAKEDAKRVYSVVGSVAEFYTSQHATMTYEIAKARKEAWLPKEHISIKKILELSDDIVDPSDPDISLGQIHHAFQTAEMCREFVAANPTLPDWLPLIGLFHDFGKIAVKTHGIPWNEVSGDSYPLGLAWDDHVVLRELGFDQNPDTYDSRYNTTYGIYEPGIGFDNILFWGHDEIIYQILNNSVTNLPSEALYVARYHSFYAWHSENGYNQMASDLDRRNLGILRAHQRADLYSKNDHEAYTIDKLDDPYYQNLINKYVPSGTLFV